MNCGIHIRYPNLEIDMDETDSIGNNKLNILVLFNIIKDPNTLESVSVTIGE